MVKKGTVGLSKPGLPEKSKELLKISQVARRVPYEDQKPWWFMGTHNKKQDQEVSWNIQL